MIRTTDLNYVAILIALKLARLTRALPPTPSERLVTFELTASDANRERVQSLEQGYDELELVINGETAGTLGDFLDGIQRARRAMRGAQAVQR